MSQVLFWKMEDLEDQCTQLEWKIRKTDTYKRLENAAANLRLGRNCQRWQVIITKLKLKLESDLIYRNWIAKKKELELLEKDFYY